MKKISYFTFLFFIIGTGFCFGQEQVTITTYYPAPYGIYRELRANQLAVGSLYRMVGLADGELRVAGALGVNVGAGAPASVTPLTTTHGGKFEVGLDPAGVGNNDFILINNDANAGLTLSSGTTGGTPYIFFEDNNSADTAQIVLGQPYGARGGIELRGSDAGHTWSDNSGSYSDRISATSMNSDGSPAVIRTKTIWICDQGSW